VGTGNFTTDDHTFKAGLNYRFNWAGSAVGPY
jgi:outer membrane immunogenic protein